MSKKIEFEAMAQWSSEMREGLHIYLPHGAARRWQRYRVTLEPVEPELKDCPHCGGPTMYEEHVQGHAFCAMCLRCHARSGWYSCLEDAAEAWNRREGA
jgi:hypothetical protein